MNPIPRDKRKTEKKTLFPQLSLSQMGSFKVPLHTKKGLHLSFILVQLSPAHGARGLGLPQLCQPTLHSPVHRQSSTT